MKSKACHRNKIFCLVLWCSEFKFAVERGSETMTIFTQQFVPLSSPKAAECSNPEVPQGSVISKQQILKKNQGGRSTLLHSLTDLG